MYYDEDLLLDLRFNTLDKYITKFVITEATYAHNGAKKELRFNIDNFKKFKDKITYIVVDTPPPNLLKFTDGEPTYKKNQKIVLNGMVRDYFQRESLSKGLLNVDKEDIILISDLDEIPNLASLNFSEINNNIYLFKQKIFYYKLNLLYEKSKWVGTKAIKKKNLISPQWLRNIKGKNYSKWRLDVLFSKKKYSNLRFIDDGGWHFTFLKTPEEIQKKLLHFAHHFEFEESGLQINDIKRIIKEKKTIYDHEVDRTKSKWLATTKLKSIETNLLPEYVSSNLEKFKDWID